MTYRVILDHDTPTAFARLDFYIVHLDRGWVRNGQYAQRVVDVLNAAEAVVDHPIWMGVTDTDVALEEAVKRLRGEL
jgi:hypothetical protein